MISDGDNFRTLGPVVSVGGTWQAKRALTPVVRVECSNQVQKAVRQLDAMGETRAMIGCGCGAAGKTLFVSTEGMAGRNRPALAHCQVCGYTLGMQEG